jgi:hypothetical protein
MRKTKENPGEVDLARAQEDKFDSDNGGENTRNHREWQGSLNYRTDPYVESHAGQPFDDAKWRNRGFVRTEFDYTLPDGTVLYQQCRYDISKKALRPGVDAPEKRFRPRRPLNGDWVFGAGARRVIYNWPAIVKAGPGAKVLVAEGEKNANDLIKADLLGTTVLSHHWAPECIAALTGYHLIILADHDAKGHELAAEAYRALVNVAKSIRIVPCAHLWKHLDPAQAGDEPLVGEDVSDWLAAGGDPEQLLAICEKIPAEGVITAAAYDFPPEATIARDEWLLGRHLLRGEVSCTAAMGGTGKSSLAIVEALAMASGKALLHDEVPKPLRVVLINLEDNRNRMDKRIFAAMQRHGLTKADIGDRLIVIAKGEAKLKVAKQLRTGAIQRNEPVIKALTALMLEQRADALSIDSLIRTHSVNENDNSAIEEVLECFEDVAGPARCAVHLWHHSRKTGGERATVEDARGAKALSDTARSLRILETMTTKERDDLRVIMPEIGEPGYYFRAFNGKRNFAPPSDQSDWFKLESVLLQNNPEGWIGEGDNVGVAIRWQYPQIQLPALNEYQISVALAAVQAGGPWRANANSTKEPWVGVPIADALKLNPLDPRVRRAVNKLVKQWLAAGRLRNVKRPDEHRQQREYVEVAAVRTGAAGNGGGQS